MKSSKFVTMPKSSDSWYPLSDMPHILLTCIIYVFNLVVDRSMLFSHCECPEEGTRNVVSECLGKLTLIDPPNLLSNLKQHLSSQSPLTRSTVVTAIKFTISDQVSRTKNRIYYSILCEIDILDLKILNTESRFISQYVEINSYSFILILQITSVFLFSTFKKQKEPIFWIICKWCSPLYYEIPSSFCVEH